eukprot:gene12262-16517_t
MLVVATSALFINEIRMIGPFSPIHIFVVVTYVAVAMGIWKIRQGDVEGHRAVMVSLYFGALFLTGAFTLLPGRRMHDVLFGAASGWTPAAIAIPLALISGMTIWWRLLPKRRRVRLLERRRPLKLGLDLDDLARFARDVEGFHHLEHMQRQLAARPVRPVGKNGVRHVGDAQRPVVGV